MRHSGYTIWLLTMSLAAATFGAIVYATGMGHIVVPGGDILRVIAARVTSNSALLAGIDPVIPFVVFDVRLPRILTATLVGGGLAMSGVIYQGILLNPLADPYTLGVSSGAAFGAALALMANLSLMGHFSVPLFAFIGAALTLLVVLYLSSFNGQISAQHPDPLRGHRRRDPGGRDQLFEISGRRAGGGDHLLADGQLCLPHLDGCGLVAGRCFCGLLLSLFYAGISISSAWAADRRIPWASKAPGCAGFSCSALPW